MRRATLFLLTLALAACSRRADVPPQPGDGAPAAGAPAEGAPVDTSRGQEREGTIEVTGTVTRFEVEGGFFAIRGDDGKTYDPTNLAEEYRQDGLRVRARLRPRPDMMGIHQVGPIVEIVEIRKL